MVQAAACRAALYGFNSHPQLFSIHPQLLGESPASGDRRLLSFSEKLEMLHFADVFVAGFYEFCGFLDVCCCLA